LACDGARGGGLAVAEFGALLDGAWRLKSVLNVLVSNADVDEMYAACWKRASYAHAYNTYR